MGASEVAIIVAALSFVTSAIPLILQWRKDKRKAPLEDSGNAVSTSESAARALRSYSDEVIRLRGELAEVRQEFGKLEDKMERKDAILESWRKGIRRLIAQLVAANMEPVWQPDEEEENAQR